MKLLWFSDSLNLPTGYGQVSRNLLYRFKQSGLDVRAVGFQQTFGNPNPSDIPINYDFKFPNFMTGNGPGQEWYGNKGSVEGNVKDFKPDYTGFLCDSFMIKWMFEDQAYGTPSYPFNYPDRSKIIEKPIDNIKKRSKTLFYFPFDSDEVYDGAELVLGGIDVRVAMSKFGQGVLKRDTGLDSLMIPHGVDTVVYRPLSLATRDKLKEQNGWKDKFTIGCVARNQSRKMLPVLYEAYKILLDRGYNDMQLVMHCDPKDPQGWNLLDLEKKIGIEKKVAYGMQNHSRGLKESGVNLVYNSMDIHVLPTCYHPDTLISCNPEFKPISEVNIGNKVLTHDSSFKEVDYVLEKDYDGEMLKIDTNYTPPVNLTPNHRIFTIKSKKRIWSYEKKRIKKNAKELLMKTEARFADVGDYVVYPRIKKTKDVQYIEFDNKHIGRNQFGSTFKHPQGKNIPKTKIDNDLMWLFGIYLAEGCISQTRERPEGIVFCISTKEKKLTERIQNIMYDKFGIEGKVYDDTRHRRTIRFYSTTIGRKFKEMFSSGAKNKKMPSWFMYLPHSKQKELIRGLWEGDGSFYKDKERNSISYDLQTVSQTMAHQIWQIMIRLGYLMQLKNYQRQSMVWRVRGYGNELAELFNKPKNKKRNNHIGWIDNDYAYFRIRKIESNPYEGKVYDLNVNTNHNYCHYWLGKNTGEGYGLPTIESMAAGVPNIITDCTTSPELIRDHGELIKPTGNVEQDQWVRGQLNTRRVLPSVEDTVNKIEKLYKDKELRDKYSKKGREFVLKWFPWEKVTRAWLELFEYGYIKERFDY